MSCVIEKSKPRRAARPSHAHNGMRPTNNKPQSLVAAFPRGVTLAKTKPMSTDELMSLIEKGRRENDPEKLDQLVDQFMEGFYGEKLTAV